LCDDGGILDEVFGVLAVVGRRNAGASRDLDMMEFGNFGVACLLEIRVVVKVAFDRVTAISMVR